MYERAGYARIERYNDNPYAQAWFEKDLDVTRGRSGRGVLLAREEGQLGGLGRQLRRPARAPCRAGATSATDFSLRDVRLDDDPPHGRVGEREVEQEPQRGGR